MSHQPGSSTVVQYDAELRWPDGSATKETIVAATGARIPAGADIVDTGTDTGTSEVAAWRWPADPGLPGLVRAMDPVAVGGILDDLGLPVGASTSGSGPTAPADGPSSRPPAGAAACS